MQTQIQPLAAGAQAPDLVEPGAPRSFRLAALRGMPVVVAFADGWTAAAAARAYGLGDRPGAPSIFVVDGEGVVRFAHAAPLPRISVGITLAAALAAANQALLGPPVSPQAHARWATRERFRLADERLAEAAR